MPLCCQIAAAKNRCKRFSISTFVFQGIGFLMVKNKRNIIVIGASAGGIPALTEIISSLEPDFPAVIFIVQHMSPENSGQPLLEELSKHAALKCKFAEERERFEMGTIYLAPSDFHLLVKRKLLLVKKGASENRYRPGIDGLFRSAAVAYGASVIGIVLTGMLDDGTAGLTAIKKCGGITIVQDPSDAAFPDMPQSVLNNLTVDYCVPIKEMGTLLEKLTQDAIEKRISIPKEIKIEAKIAERVMSNVTQANILEKQVPYNCSECGGELWESKATDIEKYRCHREHLLTSTALLISQNEKIEETLWLSLRMFEERKNLLNNMSQREHKIKTKNYYHKRAQDSEIHIERIRAMLLAAESSTK